METFVRDLRHSFRFLLKNPVFAAASILTLALGIGANSLIFSVINTMMLRPLPYEEPDRLVRIWESNLQKGWSRFPVSIPNFLDWREQNQVFDDLAAVYDASVTLSGLDQAEQLNVAFVSPSVFKLLGVEAALGRVFSPEAEKPDHGHVAVMSSRLWQRSFSSDPNVIGRALTLDGESYTVSGVVPPDFELPNEDVDLWLPLVIDYADLPHRGSHFVETVARLKPGVTTARAQLEMETIARRLEEEYPEWNAGYGVVVIALHDSMVEDVRTALLVLIGAVAFILLIACCNVANLLLVRALGREKQTAVRVALGAGRRRLIARSLTEGLLLALFGGGAGLLLAYYGIRALLVFGPDDIPRLAAVTLDGRVVGFTFLLSILTPAVFALAPALRSSRPDVNAALKEGYRPGTRLGGRRLGAALVVVEVALVLVLVIGAGLLIRSFWRLQHVDPGFRRENVLLSRLTLPENKYADRHQAVAFFQRLLAELQALPGVVAAATTNVPPLGRRVYRFSIAGRPPARPGEEPNTLYKIVSPEYLEILGIPLIRGRSISRRDVVGEPLAVVINETMARQFFPDQDPIGQRINFVFRSDPVWQEIVGIVGDVRQESLDREPYQGVYGAHYQWGSRSVHLLLHTAIEPSSALPAVRRKLAELDPEVPIYDVETLEQRLADSLSGRRFNMGLVSLFAALALVLGAVGIYGVMASFVSQRTRDIGLRMALGARQRNVLIWVIKKTLTLALIGVACGLAGAWAVTRVLSSLLFDVGARDPLTYFAVVLLILGVAVIAGFIPARRASLVDPKEVLTYE